MAAIRVRPGLMVVKRRSRKPVRTPATRSKGRASTAAPRRLGALEIEEIESLRGELVRLASVPPPRWNADPEDVRRSVAKLVLTLVEFIRQVLERQAIRRMEAESLTADETEAVGLALMRLEETIRDLGAQFGLRPEDLRIDLGPLGKLV